MTPINIILIIAFIALFGGVIGYIVHQKRKNPGGCIGCSACNTAESSCPGCAGHSPKE